MYPLTNFQQLAGLCNNEPFCKKTFSKYRLIAIILQKEHDSVLGHNLSNAFDRLQTTTGKNFAVISFVTPSKQWTRTHSTWAGMQNNLFNCDDCDEQDFIDDLQRRLNIPYLPAMILTGSLLSNEYVVAKAHNKQIVAQLEDIASYVGCAGEGFSIKSDGFLERIKTGIDAPVCLSTENGESLARNIVDLMALRSLDCTRSLNGNVSARQRDTAMSWIRSTLGKLKHSFETLANDKDTPIEEVDSARERYSDYRCAALKAKDAAINGRVLFKISYIPLREMDEINPDAGFEFERLENDTDRFRLPFDILGDF